MGFTSLSDITSSITSALGISKPAPTNTGTANKSILGDITTSIADAEQFSYSVNQKDWYSAKPYGFRWTDRSGGQMVMFLPISPNNLHVTTNFATNLVPTLYGTVEEHSEVRYFDIVIEGTTGMAPKYIQPWPTSTGGIGTTEQTASHDPQTNKLNGRGSFPIAQGVAAGGFFSQTISALTSTLDKAADLIAGAAPVNTGVFTNQSGYLAFHNLYRFLLRYKADVSGQDGGAGQRTTAHPLQFFNYKDGNQYDVAVRNFVLRRSADDPLMYQYQITLRGYNIRSTGDDGIKAEDLNSRLAALGLSGINSSSLLGDIKSVSSQVKGILGSSVGGINVLGR